jgi:peptidase E
MKKIESVMTQETYIITVQEVLQALTHSISHITQFSSPLESRNEKKTKVILVGQNRTVQFFQAEQNRN